MLLSAVLLMVAWNWSRSVAGTDGMPQIAAPDGPFRMAPKDPGGEAVPYVGLEVYSLIETPGKPSTSNASPRASSQPRTVAAPPPRKSDAASGDDGATVVSQAAVAPVVEGGIPIPAPRPSLRSQ